MDRDADESHRRVFGVDDVFVEGRHHAVVDADPALFVQEGEHVAVAWENIYRKDKRIQRK